MTATTTSALRTEQPALDPAPILHVIRGSVDAPRLGTVLFVCQANVSRSAYMDLMLRHLAARAGLDSLEISSAGLQAPPGRTVHPEVRRQLARAGVDVDEFSVSQLTVDDLTSADLVLTATRRHRDEAGRIAPAHRRKMFTLLQFRRLLAATDAPTPTDGGAVSGLVKLASGQRGLVSSPGAADDISDPTGRRSSAFATTFALVEPALVDLIDRLSTQSTQE